MEDMTVKRKLPIKAARIAAGLSQEELAKELGVTRMTVSNWENNKRGMRTTAFYLFCKITGFSTDDIIMPKKSAKREHGEEEHAD